MKTYFISFLLLLFHLMAYNSRGAINERLNVACNIKLQSPPGKFLSEIKKANTDYTLVQTETIDISGASIIRLNFVNVNLGKKSYITLTSSHDNGTQKLASNSMEEWNYGSAYFNGNKVVVKLWQYKDDASVQCDVTKIEYLTGSQTIESQCGLTDDRLLSNSNQVGRIDFNCTGWQISSGAFLTAGHCTNGNVMNIIEFNVPASSSNGGLVASNPNDQYPINSGSITWQNSGTNGDDWCIFKVNPNANTGRLPHERNGFPDGFNGNFFRCTRDAQPGTVGLTTMVTGFGTDQVPAGSSGTFNAQNQTNQSAAGPFSAETGSGNSVGIEYTVDTEPANSGSPVYFNGSNTAIGIHTNGGCVQTNSPGVNSGTGFEEDDLEVALNNAYGSNTAFVDVDHPTFFTLGIFLNPYHTISGAANNVPSGYTLKITEGYYQESVVITNNVILQAPVGLVVINPLNQLQSNHYRVSQINTPEHAFTVNPNPVTNSISISCKARIEHVLIYNSTMQLLKSISQIGNADELIDVSDLSPGIYFIDAQSGGQSYKTKFVVSR